MLRFQVVDALQRLDVLVTEAYFYTCEDKTQHEGAGWTNGTDMAKAHELIYKLGEGLVEIRNDLIESCVKIDDVETMLRETKELISKMSGMTIKLEM